MQWIDLRLGARGWFWRGGARGGGVGGGVVGVLCGGGWGWGGGGGGGAAWGGSGGGGGGGFGLGLVVVGEGREVVDLEGVGVNDGESEAVGRQGEVLASALDRRAVGVDELLAGAGLIDDDGLRADFVAADHLVGDGGA